MRAFSVLVLTLNLCHAGELEELLSRLGSDDYTVRREAKRAVRALLKRSPLTTTRRIASLRPENLPPDARLFLERLLKENRFLHLVATTFPQLGPSRNRLIRFRLPSDHPLRRFGIKERLGILLGRRGRYLLVRDLLGLEYEALPVWGVEKPQEERSGRLATVVLEGVNKRMEGVW